MTTCSFSRTSVPRVVDADVAAAAAAAARFFRGAGGIDPLRRLALRFHSSKCTGQLFQSDTVNLLPSPNNIRFIETRKSYHAIFHQRSSAIKAIPLPEVLRLAAPRQQELEPKPASASRDEKHIWALMHVRMYAKYHV